MHAPANPAQMNPQQISVEYKDILDLENGVILVESSPGEGSVFQVILPAKQPD